VLLFYLGFVDISGSSYTAESDKFHIEDALLWIQIAICSKWLTVTEALVLVNTFPKEHPELKCRLEVAVYVFSRIIDLEHFERIQDQLTAEDNSELIERVGHMNLFNPLSVDRHHKLKLTIPEQRKVATALVHMGQSEPGENWLNETFGWDTMGESSIPGWCLPLHWTEREGDNSPSKGLLTLTYCSRKEKGCKIDWDLRLNLMSKFLLGTEYSSALVRGRVADPRTDFGVD
jgi:hypothetical protein